MLLLTMLALVAGLAAYWIWVRPELRARPSLAEFYAEEDRFFEAFRLKIAGLKARIATVVAGVAFVALEVNDLIAPFLSDAGVDVKALLPQIPAQLWPFITLGLMLLLQYFRKIAARREAAGGEPV